MAGKIVTKRGAARKPAAKAPPPSGEFRRKLAGNSLEDLQAQIAGGMILGTGVRALRHGLDLTLGDVAHVLGSSERSVMRKEQCKARLTIAEGDRAYRLANVADLATEMIGDAARARRWLKTSSRYLGEKTPLDLLDTEIGTDRVIESLYAIGFGGLG